MLISVITVSYNSEETIGDTIRTVVSQTYEQVEYIVVDGGSKDGTCNIIRAAGNGVQKFISEPDKGIYDAMNKGLAMASGNVIGILNSDDLYAYNEYLADVAALFAKTGADIVYSDLVYVNRENTKVIRKWRAGKYKRNAFYYGWMPPHPTVFVTRKVYEQAGMFNLTLRSAADYEFLLRIFEKYAFKAAYLAKTGIRMRAGGISNASLRNRLAANREDNAAWQINGLKPWMVTRYLKPLRKLLQFVVFRAS